MVRLIYVPLVAAVLVATGCANSGDAEWAGYCVDEATNVRIEDDRCGDFIEHGHSTNSGTYVMWFQPASPVYSGSTYPALGHKAVVGQRMTIPKGASAAKVANAGGTIARGGFGVSSSVGGKAAS